MTPSNEPVRRALVVEDDPDFAALLETMLRTAQIDVDVAHDGEEALDRVKEQLPDLITLDIQMPNKTGLMFYRQLISQDRFRDIPVIVITGLTRGNPDMSTFIRAFLELENLPHPMAYLEKPVSQDQLLEVVKKLMDQEEFV